MTDVSPMTTPVPWSMKKRSPIVAAGLMSMPVRECAYSVMMRGIIGTPATDRRFAIRYATIASIEG